MASFATLFLYGVHAHKPHSNKTMMVDQYCNCYSRTLN